MKKLLLSSLASSVVLLAACTASVTPDQGTVSSSDHSQHSESSSSTNTAAERLENSPRHGEWIEVKNGTKTIYTWVVYPETAEKKPVVLVIHENKGLNDWARAMADEIAEAGYIAVAPDLLSGFSTTMQLTTDFATPDDATKAIGQLAPDAVQSDLNAVSAWAKTIDASNGKIASAGFCWGGGQSFQLAATNKDLDAALVFYGTGPKDEAEYSRISTPVFGFYGGADERVNASIPASETFMTAAKKTYDYEIYDGAGHAFMRLGAEANATPENATARAEAWTRMKEILAEL